MSYWSSCLFCFSKIGTKELLHQIHNDLARLKYAFPLPIQTNPDHEQAWATSGENDMQQSKKPLNKGLKTPSSKAWNSQNNSREHISLMLVQEIYSEGMVVVEHGGSPTPVPVRISLLPSAVVEGGCDQLGGDWRRERRRKTCRSCKWKQLLFIMLKTKQQKVYRLFIAHKRRQELWIQQANNTSCLFRRRVYRHVILLLKS